MRRLLLPALLVLAAPVLAQSRQGPANNGRSAAPAPTEAEAFFRLADRARILGAPTAPVWLIVISDFQCPFCKRWHDDTWPAIQKEFVATGKVRVAYIHMPLNSHPNAQPAAEAATCAGVQGKFWEMTAAIFGVQDKWSRQLDATAFFDTLAAGVGVDRTAYRSCMTKGAAKPLVAGDYRNAVQAGANSTPTFIVGNQPLIGAQPISAFRAAIEAALAASRKPAGP